MRIAFALFVAGLVTAVAPALAPTSLVEAWSAVVFPAWTVVTTTLFMPWPMSATLSLAAALAVALVLVVLPGGRRARRALASITGTVGVLTVVFVLAWGAAYQRVPAVERLDLPVAGVDVDALELAFDHLIKVVHERAPDAALAGVPPERLRVLTREAARCVADLDEVVSGRRVRVPDRVRHLPPGTLLRAGYGGISLPWLLEPHVDTGLPGAAFLMVATHELMHAAGWAREAETDALAVLAGLSCDRDELRYAAALHGAAVVGNTLLTLVAVDDPRRAHVRRAFADLPEVARQDRRATAEAVAHHRVEVAVETVGRAYDVYLRAHGVEAGLADYARAGAIVAASLWTCEAGAQWPWCPPPVP